MKWLGCVLAAGFLVLAVCAFAQTDDGKWHDEAELSYVDTGGNTQVTTFSGKNTLMVPLGDNTTGTWKLEGMYGKSEGRRNAEHYATELRGDHSYNTFLYSFAYSGWFRDQFAGIDNRYYGGAGGGYRLLTGPRQFLMVEAGLSFTSEDRTDNTSRKYPGGRLFGKYEYRLTKKTKFTQSVEWLADLRQFSSWDLNTETAITAALNSWMSLKTSYVVKYDNEPVDNLKRADTVLGASLVVDL